MSRSLAPSYASRSRRLPAMELLESRNLLATFIQFANAEVHVRERASSITVALHRTGELRRESSVFYEASSDTAAVGSDYFPRSGFVRFLYGQKVQTISFPITNDEVYELSERFNILLSRVFGAELGSPNPGQVVIDDDDIYDNLFSRNGREIISTSGAVEDQADAVAVQPDGKTLVLGTHSSGDPGPAPLDLTRFHPNGTLDARFGVGGRVSLAQPAGDAAARLSPDLVVLPTGQILATANAAGALAMARFNANGSLDSTFGDNGIASLSHPSLLRMHGGAFVVQADGKIVMAGIGDDGASSKLVLAQFTSSGAPDLSFTGDGIEITTVPADAGDAAQVDLGLTPNGLYVAAANRLDNGIVARFRSAGNLDASFGGDGIKTIDFGPGRSDMLASVVVDTKGRILVGGTTTADAAPAEFALARLLSIGGSYDATFAEDGQLSGSFAAGPGSSVIHQIQVDARQRIVLVGDYRGDGLPQRFVVQRRINSGALDQSFNATGTLHVSLDAQHDASGTAVALAADTIVAAGSSNARLAVVKLLAEHGSRPLAVVELSSTVQSVIEADELKITINRTGDTSVWAVAEWQVVGGTATIGQDLPAQSGVVTFAMGETVKTVTVAINNDLSDEPTQGFQFLLNSARGPTQIGGKYVAEITIIDDDLGPTLSISDASIVENDSGTQVMRFTITPSAVSEFSFTVVARTQDESATLADYQSVSTRLTFGPGQDEHFVFVVIRGDLLAEATETFRVVLSHPQRARIGDGLGIGTIFDNDTPALSSLDSAFAAFAEDSR